MKRRASSSDAWNQQALEGLRRHRRYRIESTFCAKCDMFNDFYVRQAHGLRSLSQARSVQSRIKLQ